MKNIGLKTSLTAITVMSVVSLASAGDSTAVPEPGIFGMFAGAVAVAIIMARIIKKK